METMLTNGLEIRADWGFPVRALWARLSLGPVEC